MAASTDGVGRERDSVGGALNRRTEEKAVFFQLKGGHLFDRLVTAHILSERTNLNSNISSSSSGSSSSSNVEGEFENRQSDISLSTALIPVSVTYMLVALNMAVKTAAEERVDSLFHTAQLLTEKSAALNMRNPSGAYGESEIISNTSTEEKEIKEVVDAVANNLYTTIDQSTISNPSDDVAVSKEGEVDSGELVSVRAVEEIVRNLYDTWQVSERGG